MSPAADRTAPSAALVTSTPLPRPLNGHDSVDTLHAYDSVNGNVHVNIVSESTSMDVLSGGESDAGDTLHRRNNNSISSTLTSLLRECPDGRRGRGARDAEWLVAGELLHTERTYQRDLELVTVSWSGRVSSLSLSALADGDAVAALARGCLALEPLALPTGAFLARLDRCLAVGQDDAEPEYKKIGEYLYDHLSSTFDAYMSYTMSAGATVALLESVRRGCVAAERAAAAFDAAAPLPLRCLLLRPLHRLLHLHRLAAELSEATDCPWARRALEVSTASARAASQQLPHAENHAALCQLQRDIVGYDKLLVSTREFVRLGCLYKHSSKGLQQRMLFLFSDVLLVCCKAGARGFRAAMALPAQLLQAAKADPPHSFTLTAGETSLLLSASTDCECRGWLAAVDDTARRAAREALDVDTELTPYEQDTGIPESSSGAGAGALGGGGASSLALVCWHRAASLSRLHLHLAMRTQLSGCLLRKFKNSVGWQKLWVVFAAFTLYFYKSWRDDAALASLPLLGYAVGAPSESDNIHKDFVFKLQFKNHVYFFRANTQYAYNRWTEVLQTAMVRNNNN